MSKILQATMGILLVVPMLTALSVANIGVVQQASAQELDDFGDFDGSGNQTGLASGFGDSSTHGMSFLGAFGVSMVEGVRVTGVVVESEDEVSATITSENGTMQAVTVVAFSGTMDMMSAMMMQPGSMAMMDEGGFGDSSSTAMTGNFSSDDGLEDLFSDDDGMSFNFNDTTLGSTGDLHGDDGLGFGSAAPHMDFFENVKMGSSVVEEGWSSPQQVAVTLVDNATDSTVPTETESESDTTFVFVMVFPYTEEAEAAPETVLEG